MESKDVHTDNKYGVPDLSKLILPPPPPALALTIPTQGASLSNPSALALNIGDVKSANPSFKPFLDNGKNRCQHSLLKGARKGSQCEKGAFYYNNTRCKEHDPTKGVSSAAAPAPPIEGGKQNITPPPEQAKANPLNNFTSVILGSRGSTGGRYPREKAFPPGKQKLYEEPEIVISGPRWMNENQPKRGAIQSSIVSEDDIEDVDDLNRKSEAPSNLNLDVPSDAKIEADIKYYYSTFPSLIERFPPQIRETEGIPAKEWLDDMKASIGNQACSLTIKEGWKVSATAIERLSTDVINVPVNGFANAISTPATLDIVQLVAEEEGMGRQLPAWQKLLFIVGVNFTSMAISQRSMINELVKTKGLTVDEAKATVAKAVATSSSTTPPFTMK